jgi:hypothetical protein
MSGAFSDAAARLQTAKRKANMHSKIARVNVTLDQKCFGISKVGKTNISS